jgi:hypothetical protein
MPKDMGYSPKPESEIEKTQQPSPGGDDFSVTDHTKVEDEARANGVSLVPIGGHGQGGAGH